MSYRAKETPHAHTFELDHARVKPHMTRRQDMRIVLGDDRNNRHPRLDRQMERSLLERQQLGLLGVTPRSLGEDEHALSVPAHLLRRTVKRLHRRLAVGPINENRPRQRHEPPQEGDMLQGLLRRDAAVRREDVAQHEHVELGLMVADEDRRPRGEVLGTLDNVELHAGCIPHNPFETARGGPLRDPAVAKEAKDNGCDYAIACAKQERAIRRKTPSEKGCTRDFLAECEKGKRHDDKRADARGDVGQERHVKRQGQAIFRVTSSCIK